MRSRTYTDTEERIDDIVNIPWAALIVIAVSMNIIDVYVNLSLLTNNMNVPRLCESRFFVKLLVSVLFKFSYTNPIISQRFN